MFSNTVEFCLARDKLSNNFSVMFSYGFQVPWNHETIVDLNTLKDQIQERLLALNGGKLASVDDHAAIFWYDPGVLDFGVIENTRQLCSLRESRLTYNMIVWVLKDENTSEILSDYLCGSRHGRMFPGGPVQHSGRKPFGPLQHDAHGMQEHFIDDDSDIVVFPESESESEGPVTSGRPTNASVRSFR